MFNVSTSTKSYPPSAFATPKRIAAFSITASFPSIEVPTLFNCSELLQPLNVRIETTNNIKYIIVDDWSSYDKTLVHPSSYVNVKVYGKATSTGVLEGGQAYWYAYET